MHRLSGPTSTITASPTKFLQQAEQSMQNEKIKGPYHPVDIPPFSQSNRNSIFSETQSTAGSLFSVHSAPPTGIAENGSNTIGGRVESGTDSPRRPVSLAIDSFKPISTLPHQTSEIDEEDNENLLTVSSLTARPLIAKSREIRSSK